MSKVRFGMLLALGVVLVLSGCASKKTKQLNSLQAQVGVLTDELVRLDQSLQEVRAGQQGGQGAVSGAAVSGAGMAGGMYRTPSGFTLPAASIQQALKAAGYYKGAVDGKIGPQTQEAVKAFQRDHGLEPDGVIGRRTWDKLRAYAGAK
jgi:murein L,D-transpeptidase YcbB/YkuD